MAVTDWEPATEAEAAMRDALRNNDQQLYFRILSSVELLLPVSAQPAGGQTPVGWGTWTTGGRTHVLAFTSVEAMRACLGEHTGPSRRTGYAELASGWPNHEWWLAVNPGLPVEGYLPAWYVSQLSRGDVRLPGRTVGARARLERVEALNRSRDARSSTAVPSTPTAPTVRAPGQRPAGAGLGRAVAPQPVVPEAFHLPQLPTAAPGTVAGPHRQQPAGRAPGQPDTSGLASAVPDGPPGAGGRRPGALGDGQGAVGAARPDGPGGLPPRRPMPARGEEAASPGHGLSVTPERSGPPANGRPADTGADQTGRRSFFEPAAGWSAHRGDRLTDRAAPPSRFARGTQPFPRRGPVGEPPAEGEQRAFVFTEDDRSTAPTRPGGEATQPLATPGDPAQDPTRPLRVPPPAGWTAPGVAHAEGTGSAEATQALPRPGSAERPEELSASIAEPVSGPPAPRRGFTPIVIEGTIIETRDLTSGAVPDRPAGAANDAPSRPAEPPHRPAGAASAAGGPAVDEPSADAPPTRPAPGGVEGLGAPVQSVPGFSESPAPDPTVPIFGSEPTVAVSWGKTETEPVPSAEPEPETAPLPTADPTVPIFGSEPTVAVSWRKPETEPDRTTAPEPETVPVPTADPTVPVSTVAPEPTVESELTVPVPMVTPEPAVAAPTVAAEPAEPVPTVAPEPAGATDEVSAGGAATPGHSASAAAGVAFRPANGVEEALLGAAGTGNTDTFLSTLLLARVLMPVAADSAAGSRPGDPGFVWPAVELDGQTFVVVYTSPQRLADHTDPAAETVQVRFVQLIRRWPDPSWSFAVNPGTPVGAKLPGEQIVGLANWAAEVGLGDDPDSEPESTADASAPAGGPRPAAPAADPSRPIVMQKAIAPSQLGYYLERGYDRVSGFVHRASELAHLTTPAELYQALGLHHPESPFAADAEQIYVLRWPAYRPSLYRIPYGGQNEAAMRAMEGWVIERPPFRGNGFAPGESSDVVAEFKVDSVRLPHGAQLVRIGADGTERVVAVLDADSLSWRQVGER